MADRKLPALPKDGALGLIQYTGADMHRYARQAQAELRASVPPGWKLVPEQWTSSMAHAGYEEVERLKVGGMTDVACWECGQIYRAMLAAAPPPPDGVKGLKR